ncbi:hypothetical protein Syun_030238 [Stephania yunnanensis]|uniref:Uncharacterized protein n=1 Tax=Stephania yunnanensis TaxID=152371 RepID=A0AAP0E752_9MAGN
MALAGNKEDLEDKRKRCAAVSGIIADLLLARHAGRRLCTHHHKKDSGPSDSKAKDKRPSGHDTLHVGSKPLDYGVFTSPRTLKYIRTQEFKIND